MDSKNIKIKIIIIIIIILLLLYKTFNLLISNYIYLLFELKNSYMIYININWIYIIILNFKKKKSEYVYKNTLNKNIS